MCKRRTSSIRNSFVLVIVCTNSFQSFPIEVRTYKLAEEMFMHRREGDTKFSYY